MSRSAALAGAVLALAAYAWLSHLLMVHAASEPWAVAAILGPMLLLTALAGWRERHAPTLVGCALAALAIAAVVARGGVGSIERLYVLQHAVIHLMLGVAFGLTLRRGARPLVSAMAERVQGPLPPAEERYTRRLTAVWTGYLFGMVAISLALYTLAPWWWWSLYGNVITPIAAAALFVGEYLMRYRLHPEFARVGLAQTIAAYRGAAPAATAPAAATPAAAAAAPAAAAHAHEPPADAARRPARDTPSPPGHTAPLTRELP